MTNPTVGKIVFNNNSHLFPDKPIKIKMGEPLESDTHWFDTIVIPDLPISRNQIDNAHWTARSKYKKELELLVKVATGGIRPIKGQVKIHIHFTFADKRKHDFDNYIHKALFDAIVRSGIIEDDNIDIVKELRTTAERGDKKQTQITITKTGGRDEKKYLT